MNVFNGSVIKQLRKAHGLTQRQLGEVLGVKKSAICMFETNRRGTRIAYPHLVSLSELFQVPISAFYEKPAETP